ncbi:MAG: hypothetical protein NVSMB60_03850 [Mycobacterium sp.]
MGEHPLGRRIAHVLDLEPGATAIEYGARWSTWGQVGELARAIDALEVGQRQIGILLRNDPLHVAALLGVLVCNGPVVLINPFRGVDRRHRPGRS